ncbi:hypothetical protein JCM33774_61830 [Actinophytocola sp. KF-1]
MDAAFDHVAAPVGDAVEDGWPTALRAAADAVALLIATFGNGRSDVTAAQVGADGLGTSPCPRVPGPGEDAP